MHAPTQPMPRENGPALERGGGRGWLWALPALVATLVVHAPALRFWFHGDDLLHLFQIADVGLGNFVVHPHGGHLYWVRNAVFGAAHAVFGMRSEGYMALLLATHLANVALLFAVVRRLFGSSFLAGLLALLWGAAAVQRGVTGWYSAHGITLVGTLALWLLLELSRARSGEIAVSTRRALLWAVALLAASLCYGVGIALALLFPFVARLLLPAEVLHRRSFRTLAALAVATPVLYASLYWLVPSIDDSTREAGLQLALLNPAAWPYVLRATLALAGYGFAALLLGPFGTFGWNEHLTGALAAQAVVAGPLSGLPLRAALPLLFVFASLCALGLAWLARRAPPGERRLLAGFALLALAGYGMTAAGRTFWGIMLRIDPELLATTARYQYLGGLGVALACAWGLARVAPAMPRARRRAAFGLSAWALIVMAGAVTGAGRVSPPDPHSRPEYRAFRASLENAARVGAGTLHLRNRPFASGYVDIRHPEVFPGWAAVFVLSQPQDVFAGRPVRFVESDARVVERLRQRRRSRVAGLLMTPEECGSCRPQ